MKAVLIANGNIADYEFAKKHIPENPFIICADGGYDHAVKLGICPDILIGDMDSVVSEKISINKKVYPARKDSTDSELILDYAVEHGYDDLILLGFIGTRMDHTLTNISLLFKYDNINAVLIDEHNEIYALKKENIISGRKGDTVSVIPLSERISGIITEGLDYPLSKEDLFFARSRGVSNVMTDTECRICIEDGVGLIIKSED